MLWGLVKPFYSAALKRPFGLLAIELYTTSLEEYVPDL